MHLCGADKAWAAPGDLGFAHFDTVIGRIGLLIGHDAMFPEPGRLLALNGVDLICCPAAVTAPKPYGLGATDAWHNYPIPRGQSTIHWHLWRVRGGENNCYMAFANMIGDSAGGGKYFGRSGIFQADTFAFPRQEIILSETKEEVGTCGIDTSSSPDSVYPTNVVRRKDLVCMRLPHWYDAIISENPPVLDLFRK
jgi:predicted amidohydrolase